MANPNPITIQSIEKHFMKQPDLFGNPFSFLGKTNCHNVLVSFSGGRSSALMAKRMKECPYWSQKNLVFCFSNTGKERVETLDFVDRCDREFDLSLVWVEALVDPVMGHGTEFKIVNYYFKLSAVTHNWIN